MPIEEQALRRWIRAVADGQASRRQFMRTMLHLGLTGPLAAQLLAPQTASAAVTGVQAKILAFCPHPTRGRRQTTTPVVAGADAAECAPVEWSQR